MRALIDENLGLAAIFCISALARCIGLCYVARKHLGQWPFPVLPERVLLKSSLYKEIAILLCLSYFAQLNGFSSSNIRELLCAISDVTQVTVQQIVISIEVHGEAKLVNMRKQLSAIQSICRREISTDYFWEHQKEHGTNLSGNAPQSFEISIYTHKHLQLQSKSHVIECALHLLAYLASVSSK